MRKLLYGAGLHILIASSVLAQSYESAQGYATGRRPESWLSISQIMGRGEDWLVYPTVDVSFNTQFEYDYQHFNSGDHSDNLFNTSDLTTTLLFAPRLGIYSDLTLDQINGPNPGHDSWLDDEGLFSSSLIMQYSDQFITLGGGQFTPDFGIANMLAPGIYGGDFVGDYSFDDQLGLFGALEFGHEQVGRHIFGASVFTVDTTFLSDSTFTPRGRTTHADGGPGNTESLDSFSITYNGIDVPVFSVPGLQYQLGFIDQAKGQGGTGRQYGYVAGLALTIPFNRDALATTSSRYTAIQPLIEYAHFDNWTGVDDESADYVTVGLQYFQGDWNFNASTTLRDVNGVNGQPDEDDYLVQAGVSYQLYGYQALGGNGQISFGWSYRRDNGQYSNMVGVQLSLGWDLLNEFQLLKGW